MGGVVLLGVCVSRADEDARPVRPFLVAAAASVDRLLDDARQLLMMAGREEIADRVDAGLTALKQLRGIDRSRPLGGMLFFRPDRPEQPDVLLFVPVADVSQLLGTIQFGDDLRLEQTDQRDRLILTTRHKRIPVLLRDGFALFDPEGSDRLLDATLPRLPELLRTAGTPRDSVLRLHRDGFPDAILQELSVPLRREAEQDLARREDESAEEHAFRRQLVEGLVGMVETVLAEWQTVNVSVQLSPERAGLDVTGSMTFLAGGRVRQVIAEMQPGESPFATMWDADVPVSLALRGRLPAVWRALPREVAALLRPQLERELVRADEPTRSALLGLLAAFEQTLSVEGMDLCVQLVRGETARLVLLGGAVIAEPAQVADSVEQIARLAAQSRDVRSVELDIAPESGVSVHRLRPLKPRRQDERLYGPDAAIYLAVSHSVLWLAVGEDAALSKLLGVIGRGREQRSHGTLPLARPGFGERLTGAAEGNRPRATDRALLDVRVSAADWVELLQQIGGARRPELLALAEESLLDRETDEGRLRVGLGDAGLELQFTLERGYVRFLAKLAAARLKVPSGD
jgi:hypothetical protein